MTVDEILARGWYVDRKSRPWHLRHDSNWQCDLGERKVCIVTDWYMRLLIERDQHRDECGELTWCDKHPVPSVIVCHEPGEAWGKFKVIAHGKAEVFRTFPEAMSAARALAVRE